MEKIIIAVDGSEASMKAIDLGVELAEKHDAKVCLMHVVPSGAMPAGLEQWAQSEHVHDDPKWLYSQSVADGLLAAAEGRMRARGVEKIEKIVEFGDPAKRIVETARHAHADMVVLGSHGQGDLTGLVLGSVAHKVMHRAPCTVISVR